MELEPVQEPVQCRDGYVLWQTRIYDSNIDNWVPLNKRTVASHVTSFQASCALESLNFLKKISLPDALDNISSYGTRNSEIQQMVQDSEHEHNTKRKRKKDAGTRQPMKRRRVGADVVISETYFLTNTTIKNFFQGNLDPGYATMLLMRRGVDPGVAQQRGEICKHLRIARP